MRLRAAGMWISFAVLVIVNLLWAIQYPAYKIASERMETAALNFWTLFFAIVMLVPLWLRERRVRNSALRGLRAKSIREFLLLGFCGIIPPSVLLAFGILRSSAANAALLSLTVPIFMTGLACVMLRERITAPRVLSLLLGLSGTIVLSSKDLARASLNGHVLTGNFVILLAMVGSSFYNTYSKNLLSRYSELEVLIYSYATATIGCALISMVLEKRPFYIIAGYPLETWVAIITLATLPWGVAMVLWMWVLKRLEVGQVSSSIYLLPFFGVVLSVITVHERVALPQILGGAMVLSATASLTLYEARHLNQTAESEP